MLCDVCHFWFSEEVQISIHAEPAQSHVINDLLMQGSECMSRFGKDRKWGPWLFIKLQGSFTGRTACRTLAQGLVFSEHICSIPLELELGSI